jgi:signal transduction histidine kinase
MMIARNVKRLERLSDAILDSTRIETNTLKLHREKVDLNEKIRNTVQDARTTIRKGHNLEIVFEPTEKPVIVQADRIRIFEVLSNLLGNAIKFTREGTIEVKLEKIDNFAVISVRDTGQGIEPEIMPKLFTRFVTGSATASGSGLGLYISRAIIEAHGGRMWAEKNYDGKGATFMCSLPTAQ